MCAPTWTDPTEPLGSRRSGWISAAEVKLGQRVLDISTGTGEAALMALPGAGKSGLVVGADIAPAMLFGARDRLKHPLFYPVAADGQALPFESGCLYAS